MSAVKDHHWRFRPYELDDLCQRHSLNFTDVGVFRRLLERAEWRPQNRGFLTTTYTELADPCGDREAMSRSIARLAKTPLVEIHVPFSPRAKGTLQVPVDIYQRVVKVSTTVDPADDADDQDDGESDEEIALAFAARCRGERRGRSRSSRHLRGIFAAPAVIARRARARHGIRATRREQRRREGEGTSNARGSGLRLAIFRRAQRAANGRMTLIAIAVVGPVVRHAEIVRPWHDSACRPRRHPHRPGAACARRFGLRRSTGAGSTSCSINPSAHDLRARCNGERGTAGTESGTHGCPNGTDGCVARDGERTPDHLLGRRLSRPTSFGAPRRDAPDQCRRAVPR